MPQAFFPARRRLVALTAALGAAFALPAAAQTAWPAKPIRLITPNSAGSGADIVTRRLAERLGPALGQTVYVENIPGAGGVLGTETLIRAPKDGYTLAVVSSNYVIFPHLYKGLKFNALADITPIATLCTIPMVLVTQPGFAANNAAELAAMAKKSPGKLTMGSSGNGTVLHLVGEYMQEQGGFKLLHVPYKGVAPVLPDLVAGNVDVAFFAWSSVEGMVKAGRLKAIGVSGTRRLADLPNVAPIGETLPGFNLESWVVVIGPAGLPAEVVERVNREVNAIVRSEPFTAFLTKDGMLPRTGTPAETKQFVESEYVKHGKLVKASGATVSE